MEVDLHINKDCDFCTSGDMTDLHISDVIAVIFGLHIHELF